MVSPVAAVGLNLPDLRFVPVEMLVPHEQHDEHRLQALVEKIREQAVLKNPPVVAALSPDRPDSRFVVLDGANRASAARTAGLPHMLVQVVPYPDPGVQLSTWYHAVANIPDQEFEEALCSVPGLTWQPTQPIHGRAMLARREALAWVAYGGGRAVTLHGGRDITERNTLLNAVVDIYRSQGRFYRVTSDALEEARAAHPEVIALVVFPHFEPAEILELASSGERLPAGITRHLISWRALRVNVPLSRMRDTGETLEEKNRWLESWLMEKLGQRHVRFYEEPTVLFDE
jgi:hypothetical protein